MVFSNNYRTSARVLAEKNGKGIVHLMNKECLISYIFMNKGDQIDSNMPQLGRDPFMLDAVGIHIYYN